MRQPLMKINLAIALAIFSFSLITPATSDTAKVPSIFNDGPAEPARIKLEANETASLMLLESVMDISSSAVLAGGCQSVEGNYSIEISADGAINKPETNIVKISSIGNPEPLTLNSIIETPVTFSGQSFTIIQNKNAKLKDTLISKYSATLSVNYDLTLLTMQSRANIHGQNNNDTPYQNMLIKSFYEEQPPGNPFRYLQGWGSESLSISGYPANLAWIRLKSLKEAGQIKRLVLQTDRLIGESICRVRIDSTVEPQKDNNQESQKILILRGGMAISKPMRIEDDSKIFEF